MGLMPRIREEALKRPDHKIVIVGHSLGGGIVALFICLTLTLTIILILILILNLSGGIGALFTLLMARSDPALIERIHCYAVAPPGLLSYQEATSPLARLGLELRLGLVLTLGLGLGLGSMS